MLIAAPALLLPFLIRGAVGGGVATATEVSTIAVLYALIVGAVLYGGIAPRRIYSMLVETASLTGTILLVLGTASAMAWAITQSGVVQEFSDFLVSGPGGVLGFLAITILVFVILGCLLEGLPAVLLLAPIMFPIAKQLGINDIHYSMVVVCAMNVGLMMPPIGVGFYIACRIGDAKPDDEGNLAVHRCTFGWRARHRRSTCNLHVRCKVVRMHDSPHLGTRQYARILGHWVDDLGLDRADYGTHSMRRTKATLIYKRTRNLRAVQLLLGHSKLESTVRYLGIEGDDALEISEQTEI